MLSAVGASGDHVLWIGASVAIVQAPVPFWTALEKSNVATGLAAPLLAPHGNERRDGADGCPYELQPASAVSRQYGELVSRSVLGWRVGSRTMTDLLSEWPVPRDFPTHENVATGVPLLRSGSTHWRCIAEIGLVRSAGVVLSTPQLLSRNVESGPSDTTPLIDGQPLILLNLRGFDAEAPAPPRRRDRDGPCERTARPRSNAAPAGCCADAQRRVSASLIPRASTSLDTSRPS